MFIRQYAWHKNSCQAALKDLVDQYPDHPRTQELLTNRAQNDNDQQFRTWAQNQL